MDTPAVENHKNSNKQHGKSFVLFRYSWALFWVNLWRVQIALLGVLCGIYSSDRRRKWDLWNRA